MVSITNNKKWSVLKNIDWDIVYIIKSFYIFGTNADQYIIITNDDTVYAFGSNSNGCLGLGHTSGVAKPTKVEELYEKQVTTIEFSAKYEFVLALAKSGFVGTVFWWGRNNFGQLGNSNTVAQYKPVTVNLLIDNRVIDVKCGFEHSLALTQNGDVFMWGLERSANPVSVTIPKLLNNAPNQKKIVSIDSGIYHSLALTESGEVYFWGDNTYNNSAKPSHHIPPFWSAIQNLSDVIVSKISCGPNNCLLLTADGSVYTLGANTNEQCGDNSTPFSSATVKSTFSFNANTFTSRVNVNPTNINTSNNIPQKLNINEKFTDIGAVKYYNISVALTDTGICYVWGECDGQSLTKPFRFPFSNAQSIDDVIGFYSNNKTTCKSIIIGENASKDHQISVITQRVSNNFNKKEFSDVAFKFDDKYIYAYKSYLIMVCEHFKNMFSDNKWKESSESDEIEIKASDENEIKIKDYSHEVYYAFLKYLYTDTVDIDSKHLVDLLDLANCYVEEELKDRCVKALKKYVTIDNCWNIYASAVKYNSQELKEYCNMYLVNNINKSVTEKLLDQYSELRNAKS